MIFRIFTIIICLLPAYSAIADQPGTSITIYNKSTAARPAIYDVRLPLQPDGYATVNNIQSMTFVNDLNIVKLMDVAVLIDPATVSLISLTDPKGIRVVEQSYLFDTAGQDRLLQRYINQNIEVVSLNGDKSSTVSGKLISTIGGLILQSVDGSIQLIKNYSTIKFPSLADGVVTRPTLEWRVKAVKAGEHKMLLSYQTSGISWAADYNLVFKEDDKPENAKLDLGAWVTIMNQSGFEYRNATVKLISGELNRLISSSRPVRTMAMALAANKVEEKSFADYHLYKLTNPITIADNSAKQFELFATVNDIPAQKFYKFNAQENNSVRTYIRFDNKDTVGLGIPLPAGRVRSNMIDDDKMVQFIGEDSIDHVSKDETVELQLGSASDIIAKRDVVDKQVIKDKSGEQQKIVVTLRNRKDKAVTVLVEETLNQYPSWSMLDKSDDYKQTDSQTIQFSVKLAKDEEKKVSYTVKYIYG